MKFGSICNIIPSTIWCNICDIIPSSSCHCNILPQVASIIDQWIVQEMINNNIKVMDHLATSDTEEIESSQDTNNPDIEQIKEANNPDIEQIKVAWASEQASFLSSIVEVDTKDWMAKKELGRVGGLDISFIVGDDCNACACYVIIDTELNIVYKDLKMVELIAPYVPGFLAFRESDFLCRLVKHQMETQPCMTPDVLLVDGNSRLHPRRVGVACHIGVTTGIPTIGVAKNLHQLPEEGDVLKRGPEHEALISGLVAQGDHAVLRTDGGEVVGAVVKTNSSAKRPVYVSVGSGVSLETAVWVVGRVATSRIPEPTRQADILSREFLRLNHPTQKQIQAKKKNQGNKGNDS